MTLKQLEEGIQYLREQGATDDAEMVVYNDWRGIWLEIDNIQYCTYDPEEDDFEFDPTIVLYTECK